MSGGTLVNFLLSLGKRGPRWCAVGVPWTIILLMSVLMGRSVRHGRLATSDLAELQDVCVAGGLLYVMLRAVSVHKLIRLLGWPLYPQVVHNDLAVAFSLHLVVHLSFAGVASVVLGCLATHGPRLAALQTSPFRHVAEAEMLDVALLRYVVSRRLPWDPRVLPLALDVLLGSATLGLLPLVLVTSKTCLRILHLSLQTWNARRQSRVLVDRLVDAMAALLRGAAGSPASALRNVNDDVMRRVLEIAVREQVAADLEQQVQACAAALALQLRAGGAAASPQGFVKVKATTRIEAHWLYASDAAAALPRQPAG